MRLSEFLREAKPRYIERAQHLSCVTAGPWEPTARTIAAFVLCTPRQPYERAVRQWREWRKTGRITGSLANNRQRAIDALPPAESLRRQDRESTRLWVARLRLLSGLGVVKAPFLACLLEPLAEDVDVCLDVWMLRHYIRKDEAPLPEHAAAQAVHAAESRRMGWPPFPLQWAIWDYVRTAGANGNTLLVNETDIGADLGA